MPKVIYQHLNFNVASMFQVAFKVQPVITESFAYLILRSCEDTLKLVCAFHQANTTPATAGSCFEHERETDLSTRLYPISELAQDVRTRQHRQAQLGHGLTTGARDTHDSHARRCRLSQG